MRIFFSLLLALALATNCQAEIVYSNFIIAGGDFVGGPNRWDDATIVGGGLLSGFSFTNYNAQGSSDPNSLGRSMSTRIHIHQYDTTNNLPNGALLGSFVMVSQLIAPAESDDVTRTDLSSLNIVLPDNARLGIRFEFLQANSAVVRNAIVSPTIGSSADVMWSGDPPVVDSTFSVGNDNLKFSITVSDVAAVPEPASAAMFGSLVIFSCIRRRRARFGV